MVEVDVTHQLTVPRGPGSSSKVVTKEGSNFEVLQICPFSVES